MDQISTSSMGGHNHPQSPICELRFEVALHRSHSHSNARLAGQVWEVCARRCAAQQTLAKTYDAHRRGLEWREEFNGIHRNGTNVPCRTGQSESRDLQESSNVCSVGWESSLTRRTTEMQQAWMFNYSVEGTANTIKHVSLTFVTAFTHTFFHRSLPTYPISYQ